MLFILWCSWLIGRFGSCINGMYVYAAVVLSMGVDRDVLSWLTIWLILLLRLVLSFKKRPKSNGSSSRWERRNWKTKLKEMKKELMPHRLLNSIGWGKQYSLLQFDWEIEVILKSLMLIIWFGWCDCYSHIEVCLKTISTARKQPSDKPWRKKTNNL